MLKSFPGKIFPVSVIVTAFRLNVYLCGLNISIPAQLEYLTAALKTEKFTWLRTMERVLVTFCRVWLEKLLCIAKFALILKDTVETRPNGFPTKMSEIAVLQRFNLFAIAQFFEFFLGYFRQIRFVCLRTHPNTNAEGVF